MTTLLVTGGAGFIGSNLVHCILGRSDAHVVIVDKVTYAANPATVATLRTTERVTFVEADIADRSAMDQVLARYRPDAILNLAAETHVDRSVDSPDAFIRTNVTGTFVLLEAARRYIGNLNTSARDAFRFLHVSTDEVFGSLGSDGAFSEITPYAPSSPYSASKAAADHLVRAYHCTYGLPVLVTNCSNNYGPFQHPEKLIPLTILNALEGRRLPIYGDGSNVRDWLHVHDHCDAILTVLEHAPVGESYNIGTNNEKTTLQIVNTLCEVLEEIRPSRDNPAVQAAGKSAYRDLREFVADRPGHDHRYAIDATKLRTTLGWRPTRDFRRGLIETARWYIDEPDWCVASGASYNRQRLGLSHTV